MRKFLDILIVIGLLFSLNGCGNSSQESTHFADDVQSVELTVAAAASLTDALGEISELYKNVNPKASLTFTVGGSGALQTQIQEGAPVDIFISAAQKQMDDLQEKKLIQEETRIDIVKNKVVLIVPKSSKLVIESFEDIATQKVKKIALGEPTSVPVGMYSQEIFILLKITDLVDSKSVYASDVRQVLSWVETGEVDCGIVYASDARLSNQVEVVAQAPADSHKPVVYPAAIIEGTKNINQAKAFLDFLQTDQSREVFQKYGFTTNG